MTEYKPIVESENYIILDKYEKDMSLRESLAVYQTEASLEREFIEDLKRQGYDFLPSMTSYDAMLANVRSSLIFYLQILNRFCYTLYQRHNHLCVESADMLYHSLQSHRFYACSVRHQSVRVYNIRSCCTNYN